MDQEAIKKILPHRDNMLLVQEAEVVDGVAHAKYHVSGDEWFLKGHFPGNPVVPGVILCEMMAQGACVLLADGQMGDVTPMFSSMNNVRFKSPVKPGDTLESESVITKSKGPSTLPAQRVMWTASWPFPLTSPLHWSRAGKTKNNYPACMAIGEKVGIFLCS